MGIIIIPTPTNGNAIKRTPEETHRVYARDATPYANLQYDKSLPFVPRYRYPVRQYYGKRSDGMFYGNHYNPTMYEEDSEWSPFLDAYSKDMGLSKRPFFLPH